MKLARMGPPGNEEPAIVAADGTTRSLAGLVNDIAGNALSPNGLAEIRQIDLRSLPVLDPDLRYGPCVGTVSQFICVGLNYSDHAREAGLDVPEEPVLFMKSPSAISGPNDDVILPRHSEKTDWEVELGIVIGSRCSDISEQDAQKHIAGYCVINDLSERARQLEGSGQWMKDKSADTFGPIGPWLVTQDEVPNVHNLRIWLKVNGELMQDSNTAQMVFGVGELVCYVSRFMTLQPGDVISTGTPFGVGFGRRPPRYLRAGDRMDLGIQGLGQQSQRVVSIDSRRN